MMFIVGTLGETRGNKANVQDGIGGENDQDCEHS